jgi:DNA repair protein SbcC/Rad50
MRPLRLELEGFTCFKEKQVVDFRGLDLFAIAGPTGAGKSSLLDAMVFALFGYVPRVRKGVKELVAQGRDRMAVVLDFQLGSHSYRVTRTARRVGAANAMLDELGPEGERSVATAVRDVDAAVEKLVGMGYEAFTQAVVLPQGEFQKFLRSQPGERRKVLQEILRVQIYERMHKEANRRQQQAENEVRNLEERLRQDYGGVSENAIEAKRQELARQVEANRKTKLLLTERGKDAEELRARRRQTTDLEVAQRRHAALTSRQIAIETMRQSLRRAHLAQPLVPALDEASRLEKQAAQVAAAAKEADRQRAESSAAEQSAFSEFTAAKKAADCVPVLEARIGRLNQAKALLKPLADARREHTAADKAARELGSELARIEKARDVAKRKAETQAKAAGKAKQALQAAGFDKKRHRALEAVADPASRLQHFREELSAARNEAEEADGSVAVAKEKLNKASAAEATARTNVAKALDRVRQAEQAHQEWERQEAAAHLRRGLRAGEACPVCEQMVSRLPVRAREKPGRATQEALEQARQRHTEASDTLEERSEKRRKVDAEVKACASEAEKARKRLSKLAERVHEAEAALLSNVGAAADGEEGATIEVRVLAALQRIRRLAERHEELSEALETAEEAAQLAREEQDRLKSDADLVGVKLETEMSRASRASARVQELEGEIHELAGAEDVAQTIAGAQAELGKVREALDDAEAKYGRAVSARQAAEQQLDQTSRQMAKAREQADASRERVRRDLEAVGFADEAAARAAVRTAVEQKRMERETAEFDRDLTRSEAAVHDLEQALGGRLVTADELRTAEDAVTTLAGEYDQIMQREGTLRGELDLSVERLTRAKELDGRLVVQRGAMDVYGRLAADLRGDRFQTFVLKETLRELAEGASHRLKALSNGRYELALNDDIFEVIDHDNARERRSAETLSGGETFLASLALALQLSEQVQHAVGAAVLDSLFLDEGFGTLDQETLETATSAIEALQTGGRMVGLITHVRELTQRMPACLMVDRHPQGSRITQSRV